MTFWGGLITILAEVHIISTGGGIAGVALGLLLPLLCRSVQDLLDSNVWKSSQRKLEREGLLKKDDIVRISFAYLYRIKVGDKYLLVQNGRHTGKYQPVGGVYQVHGQEKTELKNRFHVIDDNKIPIDESSKNDYRMRLENRFLRKFIRRFDNKADRERLNDVSREFKEELVETGILNWTDIRYRVCGRHMTELKFGEHFQIYELLLADIIELEPTKKQEQELKDLMQRKDPRYEFATAEEIKTFGVHPGTNDLTETISDHTVKILEETEPKLIKLTENGKEYSVKL